MSFFNRATTGVISRVMKNFQFLKHPRLASSDQVTKEKIMVTFETRIVAQGTVNDTLLNAITSNNLRVPGPQPQTFGCCRGTLECKTCHVILSQEDYDRVKPPQIEEQRALKFTGSRKQKTSRFACQVLLTPDMDGIVVKLPEYRQRKPKVVKNPGKATV